LERVYGDSVLMQYADLLTVPANHAGVPGISLPAGYEKDGLPIGIQLLGRIFQRACCCASVTLRDGDRRGRMAAGKTASWKGYHYMRILIAADMEGITV